MQRKTPEQFKKQLSQVSPDITLLSDYVRQTEKVKCRCTEGHEWAALPGNLLKKQGCPVCARERHNKRMKSKQLSHEEFVSRVNKVLPNIEVVSQYSGSKNKVRCRCEYGHEWDVLPCNLYKGQGCPDCAHRTPLLKEEFLNKLHILNPNIEMIGEYINQSKSTEFKCKIDGYIWKAKPKTLLNNCICKKCSGDVKGYTQEEFVSIAKEKCPNIEILGEYKATHTHVEYRCNVCGYKSSRPAVNFLKGHKCPNCLGFIKTNNDFRTEIAEKHPNLIILNEYKTAYTRIFYKCSICGTEHNATAHNLSRGYGCPICSLYKGEKSISIFLQEKNIKYECQKTFKGLTGVNGGLLSYDFFLPDYNLLIEFQGEQHEHPVDFNGIGQEYAERQFLIQLTHDNIKKEYAKANKIELLEIWYYQFDSIHDLISAALLKKKKEE